MSEFYYWLSEARSAPLDALRSAGLGYAVEQQRTARSCDSGPDGKPGIVVCHGGNQNGRLGYYPERQQWRRVPGRELWCGYYTESRPTPETLARKSQITGEWLTLDDGHQWLIPKARRWVELDEELLWDYNLPRRMSLTDDGQWTPGDVKPQYERLWTMAQAYEQAVQDAFAAASDDTAEVRFVFQEINELAVGALQVNYRVSAVELDLLGIYDNEVRDAIIRVLLDTDTRDAWIKKKLAAMAPSGESS